MRKLVRLTSGGSLCVLGLALLYLTNTGLLRIQAPYIERLDAFWTAPVSNQWVVFQGVTLLPMTGPDTRLEDQTVLVHGDRIEQIGPASAVPIPPGAQVISGQGRYLLPGLIDMHVHLRDANDLLLYAANGVTSVRDLWGTEGFLLWLGYPEQLSLRRRIQSGDLLGPNLFLAGPILEGSPANSPMMPVTASPEEARTRIAWQKALGYDFVKVYDHLAPDVYTATLQAAHSAGLPVVGHVPQAVGLEQVLAGGQQTIEHLTGYIDPDAAALRFPEGALPHWAERTAQAGVWNCPTLGVYLQLGPEQQLFSSSRQTELGYVSPFMHLTWQVFNGQMRANITYPGADYGERIGALNAQVVQALHQAHAPLLLGTDAGNPYQTPGFSAHRELELLVAAGLTPYEALQTGTLEAARALGQEVELGVIAPGYRADLLLLDADPLLDIRNTRRLQGVMLAGRWLPHQDLQTLLAGLAASYRPSWPERLAPLLVLFAGLPLLRCQSPRPLSSVSRPAHG